MTDTPTTIVRDGLLRPGPAVASRTYVDGVAAVVTGERTYQLQKYHRLYQTKTQYEIFNTITGGIEGQIDLNKVMWLEPAERPDYYDWDKRQYCYHEY